MKKGMKIFRIDASKNEIVDHEDIFVNAVPTIYLLLSESTDSSSGSSSGSSGDSDSEGNAEEDSTTVKKSKQYSRKRAFYYDGERTAEDIISFIQEKRKLLYASHRSTSSSSNTVEATIEGN
jgi:hypothetical protein